MERTYQIVGMNFTLREIWWRRQNEKEFHRGLVLQDNIPPCVCIVIARCIALPGTAAEAMELIQSERGETAFFRDRQGRYVLQQ